jgi:3D (Asp-Asp-Asp) domain-containing protein
VPGPPWRLLGLAAAGAATVFVPVSSGASPKPSIGRLQADRNAVEHERRAAVLDLYSLDSGLARTADHLALLRTRERSLRRERATLQRELRIARRGTLALQRHLAQRLRVLYDRGSPGTLDVIFGATSLDDATAQLDNLDHMTSLDNELIGRLHATRTLEVRTRALLAARARGLDRAIRSARAEAASLAGARAARTAYLERLATRAAYDAAQITRLESLAQAAEAKSEALTVTHHTLSSASDATPAPQAGPGSVTVVATGYCLAGRTATGIPVGWGVAAVDPSVIPLGTKMTIPGYGEAVAADTGGAIRGGRVDLWFPTCAQAGGWGTRSVTIVVH